MTVVLAAASVGAVTDSCSGNEQPITWEDVAGTIPSAVDYVISVNTELVKDSVLSDLWAGTDAGRLLRETLSSGGTEPEHLVIIGYNGTTIVTWPLMNPETTRNATSDWEEAELNGTTDARMKQSATASVVVSATQAWVVTDRRGADRVNDLLSGAMSSASAHNRVLRAVITTSPKLVSGVVERDGRYYKLGLEDRDDQAMALVVTAVDNKDKPVAIADEMKAIPSSRLTPQSESTPFIDMQLKRGDVPRLISMITGVLPLGRSTIGLAMVGRTLESASGTLSARLIERDKSEPESRPRLEVTIPFRTKADAADVAQALKSLLDHGAPGMADLKVDGTKVIVSTEVDSAVADHLTAGRPLELDPSVSSPSVVAHSGLELDGRRYDITLAVNQMRATVVVDYERESGINGAVDLIGRLLNAAFALK